MRHPGAASIIAVLSLAAAAASAWAQPAPSASPAMPGFISAAVADPLRPAADRARDADRHPGEAAAFAGIAPGQVVVDFIPGGGYFTRIFSNAVGPGGHVYALVPAIFARAHPDDVVALRALAARPSHANVTVVVGGVSEIAAHGPVDVFWTAQNYHDLHNPSAPASAALDVDRAVFAALKPGGAYVIEDHAAAPGAGARDAGTLHRISQGFVRDEVQSAGFVYEAESPVLHNPADPHTAKVFDPSIRGHTDQFLLKFRKPAGA